MSFETRVIALAQAIGADIKTLTENQGTLSSLSTTAKTSLVAALNELHGMIAGAGVQINDTATNGATTVTWSADKIFDEIEIAKAAVIDSLTNGAAAALDTLAELATALGNDPNFATTIAGEVANRVRFDAAQTLTTPQQVQARANIDAAPASVVADLDALELAVGDTDHNFVTDYTTAKA